MNKDAASILVTLIVSVTATVCLAQGVSKGPVYPPFGFDLTAVDQTTKPGDDFFQFANGNYLKRIQIPADRPIASRRYEMTDRTDQQIKLLLEDAASGVGEQPVDLKGKVGAFYASFMDSPAIERLGARAIAPEINAIGSANDLQALAHLMGESVSGLYAAPFSLNIDLDLKNPNAYAIYLGQGGLGLPDRDYYLTPDFAPQREAYRAYAERLLTQLNWPDPAGSSQRILALETALAQASWDKVQLRDVTIQYNPATNSQLQALAPQFPWTAFLDGASVGDREKFILTTNTALPCLPR